MCNIMEKNNPYCGDLPLRKGVVLCRLVAHVRKQMPCSGMDKTEVKQEE